MVSQSIGFSAGTYEEQRFVRFLKACGEKVFSEGMLDDLTLQQLSRKEEIFRHRMTSTIKELMITGEFADEEVRLRYQLSSDCHLVDIAQQVYALREYFPNLVNRDSLEILEQYHFELPIGAQGFFVIPRWSKVSSTYQGATKKVLQMLSKAHGESFINHRKYQLGLNQFCETAKKAHNMETLYSMQNGNLSLVPAQFSTRHYGRSARRACAVMKDTEFGLGAYEVGIMLLTHTHRIKCSRDLWIDCAGDQFSLNGNDCFDAVPTFGFYGSGLRFDAHRISTVNWRYASASGFAIAPV